MKKLIWILLGVAAVVAGCVDTRFQRISSHVPPGVQYGKIIVHSNVKDFGGRQEIEKAFVDIFRAAGINATASTDVFPQNTPDSLDQKKKVIQDSGFDALLSVQIVKATINKPSASPSSVPGNTPATLNPQNDSPPPADDDGDGWMGISIIKKSGPKGTKTGTIPISAGADDSGGPAGDSPTRPMIQIVGGGEPATAPTISAPGSGELNEKGPSIPLARFKIQQKLLEIHDFKAVWRAKAVSREGLDQEWDFTFDDFIHAYAQAVVDELRKEGVVVKGKP